MKTKKAAFVGDIFDSKLNHSRNSIQETEVKPDQEVTLKEECVKVLWVIIDH